MQRIWERTATMKRYQDHYYTYVNADAHIVEVPEEMWCEVDDADDLARARKSLDVVVQVSNLLEDVCSA